MERPSEGPKQSHCPPLDLGAHAEYLRRYALRRVGDVHVAADLVQETMVAALSTRAAFTGRSSLRTWLVAILKHKILDEYRRRAGAEISLDAVAESMARDAGADYARLDARHASTPSGSIGGPEDEIGRTQFWASLHRCLARVSARSAETFILADVMGHSTQEVCEMLHVKPGAVWTTLHRVRRTVRAELQA